jgi:hypothetical protein
VADHHNDDQSDWRPWRQGGFPSFPKSRHRSSAEIQASINARLAPFFEKWAKLDAAKARKAERQKAELRELLEEARK